MNRITLTEEKILNSEIGGMAPQGAEEKPIENALRSAGRLP